MNVQYYNATRKFNENYEQFMIDGYNPYNNIFFTSIITRLIKLMN